MFQRATNKMIAPLFRWPKAVSPFLALLLVGCGADSEMTDDTSTQEAQGLCSSQDLIIADLVPGQTVTLLNPTTEPIALNGSGWNLCQRPNYRPLSLIEPGVVIEPGGTHTLVLPSLFGADVDGGELGLYRDSAFSNPESLVDWVCWGEEPFENRRLEAEEAGLWTGECVIAPSEATSIRRIEGSNGASASSCRVAPGDCSPRAPTDPDVRNSRIRLLRAEVRGRLQRPFMLGTGKGWLLRSAA